MEYLDWRIDNVDEDEVLAVFTTHSQLEGARFRFK